jgi:hypothetical protein
VAVGFASGAYLFSRKDSLIRDRIEQEIKQVYKNNIELDVKQKKEVDKIKKSILTLLDDLSNRIKTGMDHGKEN